MDKGQLLDRMGALGEDRLVLAKILDRAAQALHRNVPAATDFLSPQQQIQALDLLRLAEAPSSSYVLTGGYEGAERQLFLFLPDWLEPEDALTDSPIRVLRAAFRAADAPGHRDFLGSLMGIGIVREKIGDILVGPDSADLLVLESVESFLLQSWTSAGRAKLNVSSIPPDCLHIPAAEREEIRDTVSSLRLDAVTASGFRMARGKAADLIAAGRVQLNWRECAKPDRLLQEGDVISVRGYGKFKLTEIGKLTKKGRTAITLMKYV